MRLLALLLTVAALCLLPAGLPGEQKPAPGPPDQTVQEGAAVYVPAAMRDGE